MERKKSKARWIMLPLAAILLIAAIAVPLSAKYIKQTEDLRNTFSHADVSDPKIDEKFDDIIKTDVSVKVPNYGYPVYVRVAIVVTWKKIETKADGTEEVTVYHELPVRDRDYEITFTNMGGVSDNKDWIDGNDLEKNGYGYYYYRYLVPGGENTTNLIEQCIQLTNENRPEGYSLSVDIIAQTVQVGYVDVDGDPTKEEKPAYQDAWGINFTLSDKAKPSAEGGQEEGQP